ncbi:MAG TPA: hypothetical protein VGL81_07400 [Polyangiaceae bacterium]|jgi:hypothetical protein
MPRLFTLSLSCLALTLVAYGSGCGGSKPALGGGGGGGGGGDDGGGGGTSTPHALGIVALGESHAPSSGTSTPSVLASFVPDASVVAQTCAKQIAGCSFVSAPQCGGSGSSCGEGETCTWDSACNPTCTATCSMQCGTGQECYFASPNQPECRQIQTFDAGALSLAGAGMATPITLFPPYAYQSTAQDAPYLEGKSIEVQASGGAGAGFDKFDETFTATTLLQTDLASLSSTLSGPGSIALTWAAGSDSINVIVTGAGGAATCTATDSSGAFPVPSAVVTAALGDSTELSVTVTRERDQWFKNQTTHGTLSTATVQPVGWLELTTTSSESRSFEVTPAAQCDGPGDVMCPDGCFDTQTDQYHCGSCTTVCSATESCVDGECTGTTSTDCTTCQNTADSGTCSASFSTCEADTQCSTYGSCYAACASGDTTCQSDCEVEYPSGYTDFLNYKDCICFTACPSECATACAQ